MSTPQQDPPAPSKEEQDKIRLKRLAKLSSAPSSSAPTPDPTPPPAPKPQTPPVVRSTPTPASTSARSVSSPVSQEPRKIAPRPREKATEKFELATWESQTVGRILGVTLDVEEAKRQNWNVVWLKELMQEIEQEEPSGPRPPRLSVDIADRILIARLSLDPNGMSDDSDMYTVLSHLPKDQTVFEYLIASWKRANNARGTLLRDGPRQGIPQESLAQALSKLDELKRLIVSYSGFNLQDPTSMFPQPSGKPNGVVELVQPLLALSSPPLNARESTLSPSEVEGYIGDLAKRFEGDGLEDIISPVVEAVMALMKEYQFDLIPNLMGDEWRKVTAALEALVAVKPVASIFPQIRAWNPKAPPNLWELVSLLGPLLRLSPFSREWPKIAKDFFPNPTTLTRDHADTSNTTLRTTLISLQNALFHIFNAIVRSGTPGREGTLQMFADVLNINWRRAGLRVNPATVTSDGVFINIEAVLLRFAEPFIDATYSKIDRIDPLYFATSDLVKVEEQTKLLASSDEVKELYANATSGSSSAPNFISHIFFLLTAYNHLGYIRTLQWHEDLNRTAGEIERELERYQSDTRWQGTPMQAQVQAMVEKLKADLATEQAQILAYQVQLLDPDMVGRLISLSSLVMAWLIRLADPTKKYPGVTVNLPLPEEVPAGFKIQPEYLMEDVLDFYAAILRMAPQLLQYAGKQDLLIFALTFLSSSWYIRNPYLKAKFATVLAYGAMKNSRGTGPLVDLLNTNSLALEHLMPSLMAYYVDCESTGTHTQFYDKFEIRRNITLVFNAVWDNPTQRAALRKESENLERFVRFINLLRNDVTFLLDESLGKLHNIQELQQEMDDQAAFAALPRQQRQERESRLRQLEGAASSYFSLGRSTVDLLKKFTAETKRAFATPEIIDRLALMLDDNLGKMVGPRMKELRVKDPERYRFRPRELLSDLLTIYINLSGEPEFVQAVAKDLGYYRKEALEHAITICRDRSINKTDAELEKLRLFIIKVEETKALLESEEEDFLDVPDEYLDPIMATIMRDPVILPSSKAIVDRATIKAHLLSDPSDPFNRSKLSIEEVIPDTELKAKIDEYLTSHRGKGGRALDIPQDEIVDMHKETDIEM